MLLLIRSATRQESRQSLNFVPIAGLLTGIRLSGRGLKVNWNERRSFVRDYDHGKYRIVHPPTRGKRETYAEIPHDDVVQNLGVLIEEIRRQ